MNPPSEFTARAPPAAGGGGYRLVQQVGRGSSAVVWHAEAPDGTAVALKVAHSPAEGAQLAVEALHASLAVSPRLPELLDVGWLRVVGRRGQPLAADEDRAAARPFLALRWFDGRSLCELPKGARGRLPLALSAARDLGEALADLHGAGLAHGDVKPDNALLGPGDRVALIDLGLAAASGSHAPRGATPRYLGQGDAQLGDGRARDLLALGILLAELAVPAVRRARDALAAARRARVPAPLGRITAALLSPEPGARPSAAWVCEIAGGFAPLPAEIAAAEQGRRGRRAVRASYLALRREDIRRASAVAVGVAPWLGRAVELSVRARGLEPRAASEAAGSALPIAAPQQMAPLEPLEPERRQRWLVALVGSAAARWRSPRLSASDEPRLGAALDQLATRCPPPAWTLTDIEAALDVDAPLASTAAPAVASSPDDTAELAPEQAAALALAVSRAPFDPRAVSTVERLGERAPETLRLATADALRLAGQLGRARSLVLDVASGGGLVADVLRRAGDGERAAALCRQVLEQGDDPGERARACLARLQLDAGQLDEAAELSAAGRSAACAEVAALVAMARGQRAAALDHARRGALLAADPEAAARLAATVAYLQHGRDAEAARRGFAEAVAHAEHAGAVLEEASYRTGQAAACVDLGEIDTAVDTARRAAMLWEEVLARPAMAARAWLARAAAHAAIDARAEAEHAAREAALRAERAGDDQAVAYAMWSLADACPAGDPVAAQAAGAAAEICGGGLDDDAVQAAARLLRHQPDAVGARRRKAIDAAVRQPGSTVTDGARLAWWAVRASRLATGGSAPPRGDGAGVLAALLSLAESHAPLPTLGKAMHAGCALCRTIGDTAALPRLDAARRAAAQRVMAHTSGTLGAAARECAWLAREAEVASSPLGAERALDLQRLVRALSEREDLDALLTQVLDALLLWTGAERGLLLLREADGMLAARAARGIGRAELSGEQLIVSRSLAERALAQGAPVVAVDAMAELSESHQSVHALGLRSVLVLPLLARGETLGVAYLDDRVRRGAFGAREIGWARAAAPVAALAIADAAAQLQLREALGRAEQASQALEQALARKETALDLAERELNRTRSSRPTRFPYDDIVGDSAPIRLMLSIVDRVAPSDIAVLLRGESGSGKELVARAIHSASARSAGPFVGENCGALPETLLESTLFGHVKGAFTGAHQPRIGLFEAADGGTLFLDEIGEMSLGMQTKLLRVLEDSMVRPVGATRARQVDVRIIAATHRDLEQMVADGAFREDLYYRLNVISLRIPPLRERQSDIPLLVAHLIARHAPDRRIVVTPAAMACLRAHPWPGNVRQLDNEIRRALLLGDDVIDVEQLSAAASDEAPGADLGLDVRAHIERLERELVSEALGRTGGNQTHAAKLLGLSRYGLHKMIKRLSIEVRTAGVD